MRAPETGFVTKVNSNGTCTRYEPANGRRVRYRPIGAEVLARLDNASVAALEALTCGLDATTATTRAKDIAAAAWVLARELEEQRAAWLKEWSKHHTDE